MPPTFAAARNTACGRLPANHPVTAAWSRKSTSLRLTVSSSTSSCASLRISAAPTIPRCPATKTLLPFSSNGVLAIGNLPPGYLKIARHHFPDELREACLRLPAELLPRLAVVAGFLDTLAAPLDATADLRERQFDEFAHRTGLACRQHEIVGSISLQYP